MAKILSGLSKRYHLDGSYIWYIDKRVKRYGRLCESTGTLDREEAERYRLHRLHELREALVYGERPLAHSRRRQRSIFSKAGQRNR